MNYTENFARNLKAARKQRQLTQKEFAELLERNDWSIRAAVEEEQQ